jgi:predicted aldo/keto reductase-like oxidoreductase/Tfp pilus assembly protein PilF
MIHSLCIHKMKYTKTYISRQEKNTEAPMQLREYGKTGKKVSLLGFGTSRFFPEDYATEPGKEKLVRLLVKANDMGINYFDTWHDYGNGQCEEVLGTALKRMQGDVYVATKSHGCLLDADETRRRLEASLRRLQVEKIHFYHMWRILHMDHFRAYTRPGGPYEGALRAKHEGLIDHICFSAHCDGATIAEIASSGYFEGVMLGYNIINFKYREEGLRAAATAGLGVAIMNPLAGGILPRNTQAFSFAVEDGEKITDLALNFCTSDAAVSVVLSGMANEKELENNLHVAENAAGLSRQRIDELRSRLTEEFNFLCNGCRYCEGCPNDIAIHKYMLSYNDYILHSPQAFFQSVGSWELPSSEPLPCSHCGLCEEKCSQHIPIRKHIDAINTCIAQRSSALTHLGEAGKDAEAEGEWALRRLACKLDAEGDLPGAAEAARRALRKNPYWEEGWRILSAACQHDDPDAALSHAEKAVELFPDSCHCMLALCRMFQFRGEEGKAKAVAEASLGQRPEWTCLHMLMAEILEKQGNTEAAVEHAFKAVEAEPAAVEQRIVLADLLTKSGRLAEAAAQAKAAVRYALAVLPEEDWPHTAYAKILEAKNDIVGALEQAGLAWQKQPHKQSVTAEYARLLRMNGKLDDCESLCRKALEDDAHQGWAWRELCRCAVERDDAQAALEYGAKAIAAHPEDMEFTRYVAVLKK